MPESFWDKDKAEIRGGDLRKQFDDLSAFKAADDSRRLTRPASPDAYKIELPADFKPPAGVEFRFNDTDPLLAQARQVMHEIDTGKLSGQAAFSKLLGLYAGARVGEEATLRKAYDGQIAALGAAGAQRVDAVATWISAMGGQHGASFAHVIKSAPVSTMIEALETVMAKSISQGASSFSQQHREHGQENGTIPGYDKMTFEQRRKAQDQIAASAARR